MTSKELRKWKKVFETDLSYVVYEMKEIIEEPCLIFLDGDLGVGKTTFAHQFIGTDKTLSPTYSILSEADSVLHGDFYRVESREDILHLELGMYLENKLYFLAEWGKGFAKDISNEIPENYSTYLLEISTNQIDDIAEDKASRNFFFE